LPEHARAPRLAAVAFIFVTILLDTLALGVIIPILPKLVGGFVDNDTASAAKIFGVFGTPWAVMQFFFSPILGGLSDRFGRRPCCCLISGWAGLCAPRKPAADQTDGRRDVGHPNAFLSLASVAREKSASAVEQRSARDLPRRAVAERHHIRIKESLLCQVRPRSRPSYSSARPAASATPWPKST
jgi:hypothetical protein